MIPDAVKGFFAEVERYKRHVGTPDRVIVTSMETWAKGVFAGMAPWPVSAIMANCYGLSKIDVKAERSGNRPGNLGDLKCVRKTGSLVVSREYKDLGLAGKPTEC